MIFKNVILTQENILLLTSDLLRSCRCHKFDNWAICKKHQNLNTNQIPSFYLEYFRSYKPVTKGTKGQTDNNNTTPSIISKLNYNVI